MQIPHPRRPVRQPPHRHRPEHRLQRPVMPRLDPDAPDTLIADDLLQPLLPQRPQRQMIIQQPAQQLTPVTIKTLLQLGVREPSGARPIKETDQRLELLPAGGKAAPTLNCCNILTARLAGRSSPPEA